MSASGPEDDGAEGFVIVDEIGGENKSTAFVLMAEKGDLLGLQAWNRKYGEEISGEDKESALKKAMREGYEKCAQYFAENCKEVVEEVLLKRDMRTLQLTLGARHIKCVRYLIQIVERLREQEKAKDLILLSSNNNAVTVSYINKKLAKKEKCDDSEKKPFTERATIDENCRLM